MNAIEKIAHAALALSRAICEGYNYTPGDSDLDDEQPIYVSMTIGDYRAASRMKLELERMK